jgi:hypothetical protein
MKMAARSATFDSKRAAYGSYLAIFGNSFSLPLRGARLEQARFAQAAP